MASSPASSPAGTPASAPETRPGTGPEAGSPASYGRRFGALMIDWILCMLLAGLLAHQPYTGLAADGVLVLEYAFFAGLFGQTIGMRFARIRCVSVTDAGPLGIPRAFLRGLLLCLVVPALAIGAGGRGWHDKAAGSIMVHA
jgi:uncharacterized RDD family membrane protein YckC